MDKPRTRDDIDRILYPALRSDLTSPGRPLTEKILLDCVAALRGDPGHRSVHSFSVSEITTKFNLILKEELDAAKKRRPELADAQWLEDNDLLRLTPSPYTGGFITAFVAYIGVIDQKTGDIIAASIKFGWRPPANRVGYEARIQSFLDEFADALRDGTIPPQKVAPAVD